MDNLTNFLNSFSRTDKYPVVKEYFKNGFENYITVFGHNDYSYSPLFLCLNSELSLDDYQTVNFLLENGADPNLSLKYKEPYRSLSPLHLAITMTIYNLSGCGLTQDYRVYGLEIIELLIKYGANINSIDWKGFTPLDLALMYENKDIESLLISNNAKNSEKYYEVKNNFVKVTKEWEYNLEDEIYENNFENLNKFINKYDINSIFSIYPYTEKTLLILSLPGYPDAAKFLLDNGADPNLIANDKAPLHQLIDNIIDDYDEDEKWNESPYIDLIKYLIKYGANINLVDYDGYTALDSADMFNFKEIIKYLKSINAIHSEKYKK
jgi:ankyrin repeat protein